MLEFDDPIPNESSGPHASDFNNPESIGKAKKLADRGEKTWLQPKAINKRA